MVVGNRHALLAAAWPPPVAGRGVLVVGGFSLCCGTCGCACPCRAPVLLSPGRSSVVAYVGWLFAFVVAAIVASGGRDTDSDADGGVTDSASPPIDQRTFPIAISWNGVSCMRRHVYGVY